MKKLLFICSQNRLRSPTAEAVFCKWPGVEAMSAGLNNDASAPVSSDPIEWAEDAMESDKDLRRKAGESAVDSLERSVLAKLLLH